MPYTTTEQVRPYLVDDFPLFEKVFDQPLVLTGTDDHAFYGGAIAGTPTVKSLRALTPSRIDLTIAAEGNVLTAFPLVRHGVIVASDSSLGTVYIENVDYTLDYTSSAVRLKSGGLLSVGSKVTVFYTAYHPYVAGVDYIFDLESRSLRRLGNGGIADGETVLVDYTPSSSLLTEEILAAAVASANALIEREVDPLGQFDADLTLGAAATYRALEIISHAIASRQLCSTHRNNSHQLATAWLELAKTYDARSRELLAQFRPPLAGPVSPAF